MSNKIQDQAKYWQDKINKVNPKLHIVGELKDGNQNRTDIYCEVCGKTYKAIPRTFIRNGGKCFYCGDSSLNLDDSKKRPYKSHQLTEENNLAVLYPELIKYFLNQEDAYNVTPKSGKVVHLQCPVCGTKKDYIVSALTENGFKCDICADGKRQITKENIQNKLIFHNHHIHLVGNYTDAKSLTTFYCDECNNYFNMTPTMLQTRKYTCPLCSNMTCYGDKKIQSHSILIPGENSVYDLYPQLRKYFVDIEDAKRNTKGSNNRVKLVCPDCGSIKEQCISDLVTYGFSCDFCSDGISYPNKFLRQLIKLRLDCVDEYKFEYSDTWSMNKLYDGYFLKGGKKYVCEMHGGQHYKNAWDVYEVTHENDILKENLAIENGFEVIVIDCRHENFTWIKNSVVNSKLQELFHITDEEFLIIGENAEKSLVVESWCQYNQGYSTKEIANNLTLSVATIRSYLNRGAEIGKITRNVDMITHKVDENIAKRVPVDVYDLKWNLIYSAPKINDCVNWVKENCNIVTRSNTIRSYCESGKQYYGYYFKLHNN